MRTKPDTLTVGGRELALVALSFKALKEHKEDIRRMAVGDVQDAEDLFDTMAAMVHASVSRFDPTVTMDQVNDALDWPTAQATVQRILQLSFPQPQGEPPAESPSGNSTSTDASPS